MKEKDTLLVVGSLLAFSLATVVPARAAGILNFTGKIINESCQIADNGGDVNVDFDDVDMSAPKSYGAKTAEAPFTINLTGYPLTRNISISLEGTPGTNTNDTNVAVLALSDAAGTTKRVGIEVFSSPDSSTEGTQLTSDRRNKTAVSQADENGNIAFNFIAGPKSDSSLDVTAGNISATAGIDIVYKQNVLVAAFTEDNIPYPYFHSS